LSPNDTRPSSKLPTFRLDEKVALITGGGTGIGRGISEAFALAGARIVVGGRKIDPLLETVRSVGGEAIAHAVACDVTSEGDRARLIAGAIERFGRLDVLVNNAGAVARSALETLPASEWERMLSVNATAPLLLARGALPHLRKTRGSIVNISTGSSLRAVPGYGAYGASKAALNHISQVLAIEAAPEVRVNVICPGGVETEIFESYLDEEEIDAAKRWFRETTPLKRMGVPSDVAAAAVYLASDAAAWVTGVILRVDGGLNIV
jgi:NAD(P)-dependent dehydrogenase (short-subunit alcohol dehydrogenase family)